ncbi:hypothetical protein EHQ96_08645 [Leptospira levettii]|uniref:Copper resistance protein CopD n=1 Tax=Leptospira levettii TaxID=2023178 RepID=A0ABY2MKJ9_9LEPT|nr:hypothetical protein [Leptospira levettii]MCW7495917.1 hypothetical protein [Leptospira levettii]TGL67659.1 hypothetical protein EHQ60_14590 [Leptospira levettii]TGM27635.1 hypothetical protein EHQ71_16630 [Leptospira levettii]TGM30048.1 hypothetical protein EHQ74_00060 [Leptospira levettii]TGM69582.1 hypothetical protein EHQ96_08645 [Leptospira levettii]
MWTYFICLTLHILSAMVWVGGMIFYVIVVMPVIRNQKLKDQKLTLLQLTAIQFRKISYTLFFILITSGFGILFSKGLLREDNLFTFFTSSIGFMFSLKIGLFGFLFVSSVYHDFVSGPKTFLYLESDPVQYERYRRMSGLFGRFNLLLSLFIAFLGILVSRGVSFF